MPVTDCMGLAVNMATASGRQMKLRNSLFPMILYSASTLHLAVDAKSRSPTARFFLDQVARRPQFKAASGP
eukprot:6994928-Prymnesium_polylepis.1